MNPPVRNRNHLMPYYRAHRPDANPYQPGYLLHNVRVYADYVPPRTRWEDKLWRRIELLFSDGRLLVIDYQSEPLDPLMSSRRSWGTFSAWPAVMASASSSATASRLWS